MCQSFHVAICCASAPTASGPWRWRAFFMTKPRQLPPPIRWRRGQVIIPRRRRASSFSTWTAGRPRWTRSTPSRAWHREHGQPIRTRVEPTQFNNVGTVMKCPWRFRNHGQSGIPVSDLFPHTAQHVDDMAIVRSMVSNFSEHTNANYFLHSGHGQQGRPSMGSWVTYGLGSECQNLPALRRARLRTDAAGRPGLLWLRLFAGGVPGFALSRRHRAGGRFARADGVIDGKPNELDSTARPGRAEAHGPQRPT